MQEITKIMRLNVLNLKNAQMFAGGRGPERSVRVTHVTHTGISVYHINHYETSEVNG